MCKDDKQAKMRSLERTQGTKLKQSFSSPGRTTHDFNWLLVSKVSIKPFSTSVGRIGGPRFIEQDPLSFFWEAAATSVTFVPLQCHSYTGSSLRGKKEEIAYECRNRVLMWFFSVFSLLMRFYRIIDRVYHFLSQLELVYK